MVDLVHRDLLVHDVYLTMAEKAHHLGAIGLHCRLDNSVQSFRFCCCEAALSKVYELPP